LSDSAKALEIRNLSVGFGHTAVLRHLDLNVNAGESRFILGPNGAGKSTLFNAITGLVKSQSGSIKVGTSRLDRQPPHIRARKHIGRSFQIPQLSEELTAGEHVILSLASQAPSEARAAGGSQERRTKAASLLEAFELGKFLDLTPAAMSHAQRKLLEIAIATSRRMPVLLLDEPASGLGADEKIVLSKNLAGRFGMSTTLIIEHDLEFIKALALPVFFLHEGKIQLEGSFGDVERYAKRVNVYF